MKRLRFWMVIALVWSLCLTAVASTVQTPEEQKEEPLLRMEYSAGKKGGSYQALIDSITVEGFREKTLLRMQVTFYCNNGSESMGFFDAFDVDVKQGDQQCEDYYKIGEIKASNIFTKISEDSICVLISKTLPKGTKDFVTITIRDALGEETESEQLEVKLGADGSCYPGKSFWVKYVSATSQTELSSEKKFIAFAEERQEVHASYENAAYIPPENAVQVISIDDKQELVPTEIVFSYQPQPITNYKITYQYPDKKETFSNNSIALDEIQNCEYESKTNEGYSIIESETLPQTVEYKEGKLPEDILVRLEKIDASAEESQSDENATEAVVDGATVDPTATEDEVDGASLPKASESPALVPTEEPEILDGKGLSLAIEEKRDEKGNTVLGVTVTLSEDAAKSVAAFKDVGEEVVRYLIPSKLKADVSNLQPENGKESLRRYSFQIHETQAVKEALGWSEASDQEGSAWNLQKALEDAWEEQLQLVINGSNSH